MARLIKAGLDYFSHDVDMLQDRKIKVIKAKYGLTGYAVFLLLLEDIYREGYYLKVDEEYILLFSTDHHLDEILVKEILDLCIQKDLFNERLFNDHKILTSKRIQENYIAGVERRIEVYFISDYLLVDLKQVLKSRKINVYINGVNVDINSINVDINGINADINSQSKVKESKEKESKVDKKKYTADFQEIWKIWLKKDEKPKASKTYQDFIKRKVPEDLIKKAIEGNCRYFIETKKDVKFQKTLERFLKNEDLEDWASFEFVQSKINAERPNEIPRTIISKRLEAEALGKPRLILTS